MNWLSLILSGLWLQAAAAHELTPAIADLTASDDGAKSVYTLDITLNIEAVVARIGPEHDATQGTPQEERYNALRRLPGEELGAIYRRDGPFLRELIAIDTGEEVLTLTLEEIKIPDVGDPDLPRESRLRFSGRGTVGETTRFEWSPTLGPIVLRVVKQDGTEGFAGYLGPGESSGPFDIEGKRPSLWNRLFGR
jgi:hypothetical protein